MKKLIACLLCALMLVAAAACIKKTETTVDAQIAEAKADEAAEEIATGIAGGWTAADNEEMTDELRAIFDKAMENLVGVDYKPIACLGTQIVAGTNYCFLTQATVVYPDAVPGYKLVFVYADLTGNAQILNIADMPIVPDDNGTVSVPEDGLMGGWAYAAEYEITEEIESALLKANEGLDGADCVAIANLGTQVVAGTNRCVLCRITPFVPNPVSHYALEYVYENLEGGAELLQTVDFDFGALCTYGE